MTSHPVRLVTTYAVVHGLAEFVTALTLFARQPGWGALVLFSVYTIIAFGCPVLIGALGMTARVAALPEGRLGLAGAVLLATGVVLGPVPVTCVVLLGVGSASFHIAAGTATLKQARPGTSVGVFEATGAFCLALGTVLGSGAWARVPASGWAGLLAVAMLFGGLAVFAWGTDAVRPGLGAGRAPSSPWSLSSSAAVAPVLALGGLALVSVLRTVANTAPQPWKQGAFILVAAAFAMLGRAVGGVLADRFGFVAPAVVGSVGVAVCWLFPGSAWLGVAASFCFTLVMAPVIVALLASTRRPALAFGLAQLFQVPAAVSAGLVSSRWVVFAMMLACAAVVLALRPLQSKEVR